jgi:hypothetical protein
MEYAKDEALKLALEALEDFADVIKYDNEQDDIGFRACCYVLSYDQHSENCKATKAITAIKQALAAQQEHEPENEPHVSLASVQEPVSSLNGIKRYEPEIFREDRTRMELDQSGEWVKYADVELLIATPPAAPVPLTDEMRKQMKERCDSMEMRGAFADGWLSAEAAHGITKGQP